MKGSELIALGYPQSALSEAIEAASGLAASGYEADAIEIVMESLLKDPAAAAGSPRFGDLGKALLGAAAAAGERPED